LNSSPYYAQANGQAESSNKVLIKLIKKEIEDIRRRWHEVLSEALWAHLTSRHGATKITPFKLVYGQEAMLPVEVNLQSCRVGKQETLSAEDYVEAMMEIEKDKLKVAKAYNKRVKTRSFQVGELVWKRILPL
jgi:hypothetical protein